MAVRLPVQVAKWGSQDAGNHDLPYGTWFTYPAGAEICFLDGALKFYITKRGERFDADVWHHSPGGGVILIKIGAKTCEEAMELVEKWVEKRMLEVVRALGN